jgi:transposase
MEIVKVERLDHLGIVASVINDLKIVEMIDARIPPDEQEEISTGESIKGMILNGLGFSNRPISLTPQFFENKPLEILFRKEVLAEYFNRFKLGRSLDDVYDYDCDLLFSELSASACEQEGVDLRFNSLDTTSFSVTGEYLPDTDEQAIHITHGYSKDHRPDLKQAVLELVVSQDGGVPFLCKAWNGNESDNEIFKARSEGLIECFKNSPAPRYIIADGKLYTQDNAPNLARVPFITHIPATLKVVGLVIDQALTFDDWVALREGYWCQSLDLCHYGIEQRWLIIYSEAARERGEKTVTKAQNKEYERVNKQLFHLQAQRFESICQARGSLDKIVGKLKYHKLGHFNLIPHIQYGKKGRPTPNTPIKGVVWQIEGNIVADHDKITKAKEHQACFVLGTNIKEEQLPDGREEGLSDGEVFDAYKGQSSVERGFRFLKEPVFFVSSLFVKKPSRIEALLMVMTLALLVYSIAQRRLRKTLEEQQETIPNQINQPTSRPTLRWVFQILEGIHRVVISTKDEVKVLIEGLTDLKIKILRLFGQKVCQIYHISFT